MNHLLQKLGTSLVVVAGLVGAGCSTMNAQLPGTLRTDVKPGEVHETGKLTIERTNYFLFWGLAGSPDPQSFFADDIKTQAKAHNADGLSHVQYESQTGCFDLFISAITAGIVWPRDYKLTAELVRIDRAPLPGKPVPMKGGPAATTTKDKPSQAY